jgi:hypothetical protein
MGQIHGITVSDFKRSGQRGSLENDDKKEKKKEYAAVFHI